MPRRQEGVQFDGPLEMQRAQQLDPLSLTIGTGVAWAHYYVGEYNRATEECRKVLDLQSDYFEALGCMGLIMIAEGRYADAVACFERALPVSGGNPLGLGFLGYAYAANRCVAEARKVLEQLKALASGRYISPIGSALVHIGLSEQDEALTCLERAAEYKDALLAYAAVFPPFKPLYQAQRFRSLLDRIGFGRDSEAATTCTLARE